MSNPLFEMMGKRAASMPGPFGNMARTMQQFNQFRQTFQGDPRQHVQNLLDCGQMSQEQFNQLQQMAAQLQKMMNIR